MDEVKLINLVRGHGCLYDINHPMYDVRTKRDESWEVIGDALKQSPRECRDKWKRIRDCYRRAQKLRKTKLEQGTKISKKPKYGKILAFLNPHLRDDVNPPDEDAADFSDGESSIVEEVHSPGTSSRDSPYIQYKRQCVEQAMVPEPEPAPMQAAYLAPAEYTAEPAPAQHPPKDKVTDFFMGLVQTVKDFPEDVQIRVKRDIFKVVSEAEELVYDSTRNSQVVLRLVKEE